MTENKHQALGLSDEDVLDMYKNMLLTRKIDERLWLLNRAGKINFVISGQGHEAAQIAIGTALKPGIDYIAPYYRDMGLVLTFGMTVKELVLQAFGKAEDPNSGGRQMPGHYGHKARHIITGSSPVATQIPHAVGFALAAKLQKKDFVSYASIGEGSTNQGDFHEALNFAGVHDLPMITVVQNNKYAISVPFERQIASKDVASRAASYGMEGVVVNGNDPLEVYRVVKEARERAIKGEGGTIIEAITDRLTAHSSDDNDREYRTKEDIEAMRAKDCIVQFKQYLLDQEILNENIEKDMIKDMMDDINKATDEVEAGAYADPSTIGDHVYEMKGGE